MPLLLTLCSTEIASATAPVGEAAIKSMLGGARPARPDDEARAYLAIDDRWGDLSAGLSLNHEHGCP